MLAEAQTEIVTSITMMPMFIKPEAMSSEDEVRGMAIVRLLLFSIRVATTTQLAEGFWGDDVEDASLARAVLDALIHRGLLERRRILAHPLLPLKAPIVDWAVGSPAPDFQSVSEQLTGRWTEPHIGYEAHAASRRAMNLLGGTGGRWPSLGHETHDLHLTELCFRLQRENPGLVWLGEADLQSTRIRQKLPDAMLWKRGQGPVRIIEFGGSYCRDRVEKVHSDSVARGIPYQLW